MAETDDKIGRGERAGIYYYADDRTDREYKIDRISSCLQKLCEKIEKDTSGRYVVKNSKRIDQVIKYAKKSYINIIECEMLYIIEKNNMPRDQHAIEKLLQILESEKYLNVRQCSICEAHLQIFKGPDKNYYFDPHCDCMSHRVQGPRFVPFEELKKYAEDPYYQKKWGLLL